MARGHMLTIMRLTSYGHVDEEEAPPTCSCGANLSSLSDYHVRKQLAGSRYLKIQPASGLRTLNSPIENTPVEPRPCAPLPMIA